MGEMLSGWHSNFVSVMSTFSITDALDIIAVTFVVYMTIKIIRETRAVQLIKGILAFVIVYIIAEILNLRLLSFIIQEVVLQWGVLAVVVLFQPEIRHALERIGRTKIANLISASDAKLRKQADAIEPVCRACTDMADKKIGALIVFEGSTPLKDIASSGTLIDASAGSELIENIFYPKSPLHDGAMIIREGRVSYAGCILPLSSTVEISKDLGTRHRAALGMSENSDAMIVVVSEETGKISYAYRSMLTGNITPSELRDVLTRTFAKDESQEEDESTLKGRLKNRRRGGKK